MFSQGDYMLPLALLLFVSLSTSLSLSAPDPVHIEESTEVVWEVWGNKTTSFHLFLKSNDDSSIFFSLGDVEDKGNANGVQPVVIQSGTPLGLYHIAAYWINPASTPHYTTAESGTSNPFNLASSLPQSPSSSLAPNTTTVVSTTGTTTSITFISTVSNPTELDTQNTTVSSNTFTSEVSNQTTTQSTANSISIPQSASATLSETQALPSASVIASESPSSKSRVPVIIGATCGSVLCLCLVLFACIRCRRGSSTQIKLEPFQENSRSMRSGTFSTMRIFSRGQPHDYEGKYEGNTLNAVPTFVPPTFPSTSDSLQSAPTERQRQIRRHAEELVTRINDMLAQEATDSALLSQYKNLSAELQWWVDQYESDWAIGLTDVPPPMYLDSDLVSFLNRGPTHLSSHESSGIVEVSSKW